MTKTTERSLIQRFKDAAAQKPPLYHAARVLLKKKPKLPPNGKQIKRWWSGIDPTSGWQDFLSSERVFEAREYERRARWHQSCYHGDAGRVNEYTLLAVEACGVLPQRFVIPSGDSHRGILHLNRDAWTFFLYRLATEIQAAYGLDIYGLPPYADFAFPGLEALVACTSENSDREERMMASFRKGFYRGTGSEPRFVYAGLRLDVFSASLMGLRYLSEHKDKLYGSPDVFDSLIENGRATSASLDRGSEIGDTQKDQKLRTRKRGQNEERDAWLYKQCVADVQYAVIVADLKQMAKNTGWYELESPQSVQQAAVRYAKRHELPLPLPA